jgi:hypothetical protein
VQQRVTPTTSTPDAIAMVVPTVPSQMTITATTTTTAIMTGAATPNAIVLKN